MIRAGKAGKKVMDIILNEGDIKKIVTAYLEAKGNQVSDIITQVQIPNNRPGMPPILSSMGMMNPVGANTLESLLADNSPYRPTFSLKCSVSNE